MREHLRNELLPLWDRYGWDAAHGGFHSRLSHDLQPVADGSKRLIVQMRQLYAYAWIAAEGCGWARERADSLFAHVNARFWDRRHGGWFLTTTPAGDPLDRTKDFYAHAFALLGLAFYHRIAPESGALERAGDTLDLLERHLADPRHGGFQEGAHADWSPRAAPRRHNPHMHLLEALLALVEISEDVRFAEAGERLVTLFVERLYPAPHAGLAEVFDQGWTPIEAGGGPAVEPGHHFEWFWLLDRARRLGLASAPLELCEALFDFAEIHGVDRDGAVFDGLAFDGSVRVSDKRVWPQTEYLKALTCRVREGRAPRSMEQLRALLVLCMERYVDPQQGFWYEHADRAGRIKSSALNATTVYHVLTALEEVPETWATVESRECPILVPA